MFLCAVLSCCCLVSTYALLKTSIITTHSSQVMRKSVPGSLDGSYSLPFHGNRLQVISMNANAVGEEISEEVAEAVEPPLSSISSVKEGFELPKHLNGSDVRVGIIMARWNADIVQGLYKVDGH